MAIHAAGDASLGLYLRVATDESFRHGYDVLTVDVVTYGTVTKLETYSNLHAGTSCAERTFDVTSFAGRATTLRLTATEDSSVATSFIADDLHLTAR